MVLGFGAKTDRENHNVKLHLSTATGNYLGPGAYSVEKVGSIQPARSGKAPFQSTASRKFGLDGSPAKALPGPGNYNVDSQISSPAMPASSFHSKTDRFHHKADAQFTPGPGSYAMGDSFSNAKGGGKFRSLNEQQQGLMWMRVPTAPSIPTKMQSYGYEEGGDHGELVMQKPAAKGYSGLKGDVAGPGAYSANENPIKKAVRAVDFSKGARRPDVLKMSLAAPTNPGPGDYNLGAGMGGQYSSDVYVGNMPEPMASLEPKTKAKSSVFKSTTNRAPVVRRPKDKTPGPGDYDVIDTHEVFSKMYKQKEQSFGSTVARFREGPRQAQRMYGNPGPGAYETAFKKKVRRRAQMGPNAPISFNSTAPRMVVSKSTEQMMNAAPGSYNHKGMVDDVQKKLRSRTGAFGSTQKRFTEPNQEEDRPGPGDYRTEGRLGVSAPGAGSGGGYGRMRHATPTGGPYQQSENRVQMSSMFASEERRFIEPLEKAKALVPPPGAYEKVDQWTTNVLPMGKGSDRFNALKQSYDTGIGPGSYETRRKPSVKGTGNTNVMSKAPARFKPQGKPTKIPGPGQYKTEHSTSLIKKTFNIAVAENCTRL
mmetsp:Transcript_28464/g.37212  ORF Transcript_28464/g.37212 Transcript_28464/m.37212 type:complete len:594 (+) Transcript_28464:173-1954(+)